MRYGFTGTQRGMTQFQKEELVKRLEGCTEFVFGDCIGSDVEAANIAIEKGIKIFSIYPQNKDSRKRAWFANNGKDIKREDTQWIDVSMDTAFAFSDGSKDCKMRWFPAKAPLERNKEIVLNCDKLIATPKEFEHTLRSGTWATIRFAWKIKREVIIIPPVIRDE